MNNISSYSSDTYKCYIKNLSELTSTGEEKNRRTILNIIQKAISAADPELVTRSCINFNKSELSIQGKTYPLTEGQRIFVIGAGKASFPIAKVLDDIIGSNIYKSHVVCKRGQEERLAHITIAEADHPLPSRSSEQAVQATLQLLNEVRSGDIVIACFTGGSSSLFTYFAEGISLDDARSTYKTLLTCGANIVEINAVRKHISQIKGGRLAKYLPSGTHLINLTVSDVIGDRMDCITCPTVPDESSFEDAKNTLTKYQLWDKLPSSVTHHIKNSAPETASINEQGFSHLDRQDVLLVTTDAACLGAAQAAESLGYHAHILSTQFEGESRTLAQNMIAIAREISLYGRPFKTPCVLIGGGETTVTISGQGGIGGPNQEFATSAAIELKDLTNVIAAAIDTDGTDGPTMYAGALADNHTVDIAKANDIDLNTFLLEHNVTPALELIKHVITTGNTGTNVNDLKLILIDK